MSKKDEHCSTCAMWAMSVVSGAYGECRFNAPCTQDDEHNSRPWPRTAGVDWCGKFTPKDVEVPEEL